MEHLSGRGTARKLSRRDFLKLATGGVAVGALAAGVTNLQNIGPYLEGIEDSKTLTLYEEARRGWAQRDALVTVRAGDRQYQYFGSNIKRQGNQIKFEYDKRGYQHIFKITEDGVKGPYFSINFAHGNNEVCSIEVDHKKRHKFNIDPKLLFPPPYLSQYEFYSSATPDFYDGLITVFSQAQNRPVVSVYTREPTMPEGTFFYPNQREFFNTWEVIDTGKALKLGKRTSLKDIDAPVPLKIIFGKNQGVETLASLYESFFLKIN